jgi:hypothetical protein
LGTLLFTKYSIGSIIQLYEGGILMKNKKKINYYAVAVLSSIGLITLVILLSILYTSLTKPKADYTGFAQAMKSYVSINKDISKIERIDGAIFDITVNDSWYSSSEREKALFCKNVLESIYAYAIKYKLIYKDTDMVWLTFYDSDGLKVADQDLTDFKILY